MSRAAVEWTDARLNDLAATLEPVPSRLAGLAASVERLTEESRALRMELAAAQRQLLQLSWGLLLALVGAAAAIAGALI